MYLIGAKTALAPFYFIYPIDSLKLDDSLPKQLDNQYPKQIEIKSFQEDELRILEVKVERLRDELKYASYNEEFDYLYNDYLKLIHQYDSLVFLYGFESFKIERAKKMIESLKENFDH